MSWGKAALLAIVAVASVAAGVWVAGAVFLALSGAAPVGTASLATFYSYAYWHGGNAKVAAWLYLAGLAGALVAALPVIPLVMPKAESLHGDARWATRAEVRKAGLLE